LEKRKRPKIYKKQTPKGGGTKEKKKWWGCKRSGKTGNKKKNVHYTKEKKWKKREKPRETVLNSQEWDQGNRECDKGKDGNEEGKL